VSSKVGFFSNIIEKKTPPQRVQTETNFSANFFNNYNCEIPISLSSLTSFFMGYEKAKAAKKQISSLIKSYAANTFQGLVR